MILSEQELINYLDTITFGHGRKLPKIEDVYHAGIGFFYVSFRRQLGTHEMLEISKTFSHVELIQTVHKSTYPRYRMFGQLE